MPVYAETGVIVVLALLGSGLLSGFIAGLFGIGGGFVVVPAVAFLLSAIPGPHQDKIMHLAVGTSLATIVVTSLRSTFVHARLGAVDFQVLVRWSLPVTAGASLGILILSRLDSTLLAKLFAVHLMMIGTYFWIAGDRAGWILWRDVPAGRTKWALGGLIGGYCSALGISGGTLAILVMTLSGRPIHQAVATAAGFGALVAVPGTALAIAVGVACSGLPFLSIGYVNLAALILITLTSFFTIPLGAKLAHYLTPRRLRHALCVYLFATSGLMFSGAISQVL